MCRMIAIIGNPPQKRDLLLRFRCLSIHGKVPNGVPLGHEDGWGFLSYKNGLPTYLMKSIDSAWKDQKHELAIEKIAGDEQTILLHLRKASSGHRRSLENTQPFVSAKYPKWSFSHNGTIYSPLFRPDSGESDSRILFEKLLETIEKRESSISIESAITNGLERIREEIINNPGEKGTYSSLTFMLSDGESAYILRDFTSEKNSDYYTMFYLELEGAAIFCQEKILDGSWKPLANKELATVNRAGTVTLTPSQ